MNSPKSFFALSALPLAISTLSPTVYAEDILAIEEITATA